MGPLATALIAIVGLALTIGAFGYVYRDATRLDIGHPLFWATVTAGTIAVGFYLFLFVDAAPMTGVILTANTGPVLYTFEREVATEDDEPPEPGQLPHRK
ncbi:hypothetical protein [Halosolutus gelatinilyticus]|uniref:hypothetical protein n=1 Tax=Halosolutus gelatinilyticus TaxID=2931975 RepID=UPI001FF4E2FD|nr:hypothetical protein [Halosolutus gelatinilyticus]